MTLFDAEVRKRHEADRGPPIPKTERGVVSGYFNDPEALAREAAASSGKAPGIYFTLNPVNPALLARAANRSVPYAKITTSDADIVRRRWLPLDFDPVRPSGISATEAEHQAALARARECRAFLITSCGVPADAIVLADSGNGGHLLIRIDLPNDTPSHRLVRRCLDALAAKGENLPEHPHRLARLLDVPTAVTVLPSELLDALARRAPADATTSRTARATIACLLRAVMVDPL